MSTSNTNPEADTDLEPGEQFGWTYGLTHDGDLLLTELNRPRRINDIRAVIQDLKIALLTIEGEDPMRQEYGLNVFEAVGTSDAQLRSEIIKTIGPRQDERVQRINEIVIDREGGNRENVDVTITITLVDGTTTQFDFAPRRRIRR